MKEAIVATAGSSRTILATFCCNSFMAMKEMSWAASVVPMMMPVSCCGKKPFGTAAVKHDGGHERQEPHAQHEAVMAQHPAQPVS